MGDTSHTCEAGGPGLVEGGEGLPQMGPEAVQLEPGGLVPNLPTRPEAGMTMPVSQTGNLKLREVR